MKHALDLEMKIKEFLDGIRYTRADMRDIYIHICWMKSQMEDFMEEIHQVIVYIPSLESLLDDVKHGLHQPSLQIYYLDVWLDDA